MTPVDTFDFGKDKNGKGLQQMSLSLSPWLPAPTNSSDRNCPPFKFGVVWEENAALMRWLISVVLELSLTSRALYKCEKTRDGTTSAEATTFMHRINVKGLQIFPSSFNASLTTTCYGPTIPVTANSTVVMITITICKEQAQSYP